MLLKAMLQLRNMSCERELFHARMTDAGVSVRAEAHGGDVALWIPECSPYLAPDEGVCLV